MAAVRKGRTTSSAGATGALLCELSKKPAGNGQTEASHLRDEVLSAGEKGRSPDDDAPFFRESGRPILPLRERRVDDGESSPLSMVPVRRVKESLMTVVDVYQPATMLEVVATTRWGRYTTEVAENALLAATEIAGTPGAALEVGCEGGRWSRLLSNMGWALTCTDIDADVLAVCQQLVPTAFMSLPARQRCRVQRGP
jgi:hypothetical protein